MIARPDLNFKLWDWAVGAGGLAGKAWAGELIHTSLLDVNDLLARGALGKLEGGVEYGCLLVKQGCRY